MRSCTSPPSPPVLMSLSRGLVHSVEADASRHPPHCTQWVGTHPGSHLGRSLVRGAGGPRRKQEAGTDRDGSAVIVGTPTRKPINLEAERVPGAAGDPPGLPLPTVPGWQTCIPCSRVFQAGSGLTHASCLPKPPCWQLPGSMCFRSPSGPSSLTQLVRSLHGLP